MVLKLQRSGPSFSLPFFFASEAIENQTLSFISVASQHFIALRVAEAIPDVEEKVRNVSYIGEGHHC